MRRTMVAVSAVAAALVGSASAQAYEFNTGWGHAIVDDHPFHNPTTGELTPAWEAFPRVRVIDAKHDGHMVRAAVWAFDREGDPLWSGSMSTGDEDEYKAFDNHVNVDPKLIDYLRYDFCRADGLCAPSHYIGRPPPPAPDPDPDPDPGPPPSPGPVDRDGDGVPQGQDCSDTNSTVRPGAAEFPGNGIDEDCDGSDRPAKITAMVSTSWAVSRKGARIQRMRVTDAPPHATITVLCFRKRCPFRRRERTASLNGYANLKPLFKRRLRFGVRIEVRVTAPNMIGKVVRYERVKRRQVPTGRRLCLGVGATKPSKCSAFRTRP